MSALAAAAIGAFVTAVIGLLVWLSGVPGDVEEHDRLIGERDEDLATWIADEKLRLDRERTQIMEELASRNLLFSGTRLSKLATANERALHAYRDQERGAQRFAAELAGRERFAHRVYRRLRRRSVRALTTIDRAQPILNRWRQPESYGGSPVLEIVDPTARTLESVIAEIDTDSSA